MSTISGGYQGVGANYDHHDEGGATDDAGAHGAGAATSEPGVNESVASAHAADPAASVLQAKLAIASSGSAGTQATADAGRLEDLQGQLTSLEGEKASLQSQIDDPKTDSWDAMWLEGDLASVKYQISNVKDKISDASGAVNQDVSDEEVSDSEETAVDGAWRSARMWLSVIDDQVDQHIATREKKAEQALEEAPEKELERKRGDLEKDEKREDVERAGPRPSPDVLQALTEFRSRADTLPPTREGLDAFHHELEELRGRHY